MIPMCRKALLLKVGYGPSTSLELLESETPGDSMHITFGEALLRDLQEDGTRGTRCSRGELFLIFYNVPHY
jgi:hypothetical protein